jgi:hypothetical protein
MTTTWDSKNDGGMPVAAGTYFAVLSEGTATHVEKLIVK